MFKSTRHLISLYAAISTGRLIPRSDSALGIRMEMYFFFFLLKVSDWGGGRSLHSLSHSFNQSVNSQTHKRTVRQAVLMELAV